MTALRRYVAAEGAWLRWLMLSALFLALILVMLRPKPSGLLTRVPANIGDPALIIWILSWGRHALTSDPLGYFDANMFWPHDSTLAYSESLIPIVPVFALFEVVTGSWSLALSLTTVALFFLSMCATYALTKWFTGRADAAVLSAIAFTFSGYMLAHWGHIQLSTAGFLPLAFLTLFKLLDERRMRLAAVAGLLSAALALSALYYGAIYAVAVLVILLGYLIAMRFRPSRSVMRGILVGAAISAVILVPAALPYLELRGEGVLKRDLYPEGGLNPIDVITPAPGSYAYGELEDLGGARDVEHRFFPGFSVALLATLGLFSLVRRQSSPNHPPPVRADRRIYLGLLVIAGAVSIVLASGPTFLGEPAPFRLFHSYVPGFGSLRITARFAVVALLVGAVLAGVGYAFLANRLRRLAPTAVLAVVLGGVMLVELAAPVRWARLDDGRETTAVYKELQRRPPGAVVELPLTGPSNVAWPYIEAPRLVYSTLDWHPRLNGYSGFFPTSYLEDVATIASFPSRSAMERLKSRGIRYALLHFGTRNGIPMYSEEQAERILSALPPRSTAKRFGDSYLIDLEPAGWSVPD
jgi:hypothetical protein